MEIAIALLMFMGGETKTLKEHLYIQDQKMSSCLKMQRQAKRSYSMVVVLFINALKLKLQ